MKFLKGIVQAIGGVLALIWVWMGSVFAFAGMFGPWIFLAVVLFVIGLVLTLLGFDLNEVDLWLEAHGGLINALGSGLFRAFCGVVLLLCAFAVGYSLWLHGIRFREKFTKAEVLSVDKRKALGVGEEPVGCIGIAVFAVVGYFAWFGTFGA